MKTIFELNQSQANGVTYAASHILRRIKARAYSLEAWRARQCLDYARDDRRAALAELEDARNAKK